MPTHSPVPATVTKIANYQACAVPIDPTSAPAAVREGIWFPVKDFLVGDAVTLHWHATASRGLWYPVRAEA